MSQQFYTNGGYRELNPDWHVKDSPWKANMILRMMQRCDIAPKTICEVGCGAGEILRQLQQHMPKECRFWGYEISPQAFELCQTRANERLRFELKDIQHEEALSFDLILLIDVIEHLEDCLGFLRRLKSRSRYKILHVPLDLSVQSVLRRNKLTRLRQGLGHVQYFTKDLALEAIKEAGYQVLDCFYTGTDVELPGQSIKHFLARLPRKLAFAIHRDMAVRMLGGFSLMVSAE